MVTERKRVRNKHGDIRGESCSACPYRLDVPSGLWAAHEYDKLRAYDLPTPDQPFAPFACHATPDHLCHGWSVVHTSRGHEYDLLALRMLGVTDIPPAGVPLFASGGEAADWGQRDLEHPGPEARAAVARLLRKYPRLSEGGDDDEATEPG